MSWLGSYIKKEITYQLQDISAVKINHKYNERLNKFFIDSRAGLLTYKPKDARDIARFRDKWINRVELLRLLEIEGTDIKDDLFQLYSEIIDSEKVKYEANINTRFKKCLSRIKNLV